jgi:hypothetical protein
MKKVQNLKSWFETKIVTTLALGLRQKQGLAKVQA